jgi:two-component system NtrC family sensor kinase
MPSENKESRTRVLAADSDPSLLGALADDISADLYDLVMATSGEEGFATLLRCADEGALPSVVVAGIDEEHTEGIELLVKTKERYPEIQRILISATYDVAVLEDAINRCEVHRVLRTPWTAEVLSEALETASALHDIICENRQLALKLGAQNTRLREWNENLERTIEDRTRQLRLAKHEQTATLDAIDDPVILIDLDYTVKRANAALARHGGTAITAMTGKKCYEIFGARIDPCPNCPVPEVKETGHSATAHISLKERGMLFSVAAFPTGEPLGTLYDDAEVPEDSVVCVHRDITDEERLQQKLYLSQKMAALGELAGSVAHEINNPLGGILAFAQIMKREVPEDDEKHEFLECIEDSANRCRNTVRHLLNYARFSPREERQLTSMSEVAAKATAIIQNKLKMSGVEIDYAEIAPGADQRPIYVNSNEVQGVLINLLTNAADAMTGGGIITVRVKLDDTLIPPMVVTTVSDEGEGIAAEHLSKIFDPFFTTKDEGKGTGLGLAISYRVMQDNGGTIEVESITGEGTLFTIALPIDMRGESS